ncbi:MAG: GNAT family N-acetyltransferase [Candidatus Krumholzibacteria bacterium]|nr:GNAT family N-acetyltransferase [Candidatus Krumholzibacteria bacterium]
MTPRDGEGRARIKLTLPRRIETKRLVLRPHEPDDAGPFVEFMTNVEATRYLDFDTDQKTEAGARSLLEYVIASYETPDPVFALAVVDKQSGAYLGSCGLAPLASGEGVQCYYSLLPRYWGWGFATEALQALLFFAFEELGLERVVSDANTRNPRGWKVARTVGMHDEGEVSDEGGTKRQRFALSRRDYLSRAQRMRRREETSP